MFQADNICCVSDIHIGVHQNSSMWHNITLDWVRWLRDDLRKRDIRDIMICGDLFHYRDEIALPSMQVATEFLSILSDFNIFILPGNHDAYYKDNCQVTSLSILKGYPNIKIMDTVQTIKYKDTNMLVCPWGTSKDEMVDCDIMFGHFEISTFKMNHFKTCTTGVKYNDILSYTDLVLTGHFHHREERKYKCGDIIYLGNPFQMDFGDIDCTKGYYILNVPEKKTKFVRNNISPKHVKIKLSDLADDKQITDAVAKKLKNNLVRFNIDLYIMTDDLDLVLRSISKHHPMWLDVEYSVNFNNFGLEDSSHDLSGVDIMSAIDEFINLLEIDNKQQVLEYVSKLYKEVK